MIITLSRDANPKAVQAALQAMGLWTQPMQGEASGQQALQVMPYSRRVSLEAVQKVAGVAEVFATPSAHPLVDGQSGRTPVVAGVPFGGRPREADEPTVRTVHLGDGEHPVLMAGPCSVESDEQIHEAAALVAKHGATFLRGGAFKPRTSPYSFQGHGREALRWMRDAADAHGLGVVTEVMSESAVDDVAAHADLLQIGSRNMQNYALLHAAGRAGKPILLKRGMAADVEEWLLAAEHALSAGATTVIFCERGVRSFDGSTRNLLDLAAVSLLKHVHRQPVVVDPSHALGRRDLIVPLSAAAIAAGADGLLVETHPSPIEARSDGPQALDERELDALAHTLFHGRAIGSDA